MTTSDRVASFERQASEVMHRDVPLDDICTALDKLMRQQVSYAAAAWSTHDPTTGLSTACTLTGIPEDPAREAAIFRHEFSDDEPMTYLEMITQRQHVAVLSEVTDGQVDRAARFREVFSNFGVTDELRAILWDADQPWGSLSLYRMGGTFSSDDASFVATTSPSIANALRLGMLRAAATRPEGVAEPPGVLRVERDGTVRPLTEPAERWLELGGPALATTARSTASALHERSDWRGATARVVTEGGPVLALHAAHTLADDGAVAVIVGPARASDVGSMLVDAYGLTPRQREVVGLLLLGRSLAQIARDLGISEHTANDHRKAIYRRVGVSSRSELAALLQAEWYDPRTQAGRTPSPYGGYLAD